VRDLLLKQPSQDFDIVVEGTRAFSYPSWWRISAVERSRTPVLEQPNG
jgi:hypothetical protein